LSLCAVHDGCSRRVLGYAFADSLHTDVVEAALRRTVTFRGEETGPTAKVIFHADRGCPYTSTQLGDVAEELDVRLSVDRTGAWPDNAQQKSFWSTPKAEHYQHWFDTHADAITGVSTWIQQVYDSARRHSALGQISPVRFEHQLVTAVAQAALTDMHPTGSTPHLVQDASPIGVTNDQSASPQTRQVIGHHLTRHPQIVSQHSG